MIITHNIEKMDLAKRGPTPSISVVQDDKYSRKVAIPLFSNGTQADLTGLSVLVRYRKPDGTGGSYDTLPDDSAAGTISGNTVTVALAPQVCTVPGTVKLTACLISGEQQLHTFAVDVNVQANPGLQVTSENYYRVTGALADSGWTPNMYLATDADGNVVTVEAPEGGGGGGATVEEVLAAIPQATDITVVKADDTITLTTTLDDGSVSTSVVTLDSNGYPSTVVTDGVECSVSWDGFDDAALAVWEGGSY